jgi:hypothetical protein
VPDAKIGLTADTVDERVKVIHKMPAGEVAEQANTLWEDALDGSSYCRNHQCPRGIDRKSAKIYTAGEGHVAHALNDNEEITSTKPSTEQVRSAPAPPTTCPISPEMMGMESARTPVVGERSLGDGQKVDHCDGLASSADTRRIPAAKNGAQVVTQ